jgi:hypothetical protein
LKQQHVNLSVIVVAAGLLLTVPAVALCQVAGSEGIKQGEKFAKAGGRVLDAVADARRDIDNTLKAYNALVKTPSRDVKSDYKKLQKALDKAKNSSAKVKPLIDKMNVESEAYYKIWSSQVADIGGADLRSRGEERIADSRKKYGGILDGLRTAGGALTPFVSDHNDQINFLGSDLRPGALASLTDNATKLNARGANLFSDTDSVVKAANDYFAPLRSK